jgi:hypothetical protein
MRHERDVRFGHVARDEEANPLVVAIVRRGGRISRHTF